MAVGERIKRVRKLRGLTQKELGVKVGFAEKTADVRMAQYETGIRTPKEKLITNIAEVLDVSPDALNIPDIDNYQGLIHTLFALEDIYGIKINNDHGHIFIDLDNSRSDSYLQTLSLLNAWSEESEKLKSGEITQEEYDAWRYNYPKYSAERSKADTDEIRNKRKMDQHDD